MVQGRIDIGGSININNDDQLKTDHRKPPTPNKGQEG